MASQLAELLVALERERALLEELYVAEDSGRALVEDGLSNEPVSPANAHSLRAKLQTVHRAGRILQAHDKIEQAIALLREELDEYEALSAASVALTVPERELVTWPAPTNSPATHEVPPLEPFPMPDEPNLNLSERFDEEAQVSIVGGGTGIPDPEHKDDQYRARPGSLRSRLARTTDELTTIGDDGLPYSGFAEEATVEIIKLGNQKAVPPRPAAHSAGENEAESEIARFLQTLRKD